MALPKQTADINLSGGENQGTDPRLLDPPHVVDSLNLSILRHGEVARRYGYDTYGGSGTQKNTLLVNGEATLCSVSPAAGGRIYNDNQTSATDIHLGAYPNVTGTEATEHSALCEAVFSPLVSSNYGAFHSDSATLKNAAGETFTCVVWSAKYPTAAYVAVGVMNTTTRAWVLSPYVLPGAYGTARVVATGSPGSSKKYFVIVAEDTLAPTPGTAAQGSYVGLDFWTIDASVAEMSVVARTFSGGITCTQGRWDIVGTQAANGNGDFCVVSGLGGDISLRRVTETGSIVWTGIFAAVADDSTGPHTGIAVHVTPDQLNVVYAYFAGGGLVAGVRLMSNGSQVTGAGYVISTLTTNLEGRYVTIGSTSDTGTGLIFATSASSYDGYLTNVCNTVTFATCTLSLGSLDTWEWRGWALASKLFKPTSQTPCVVLVQSNTLGMGNYTDQSTYVICSVANTNGYELASGVRACFARDMAYPVPGDIAHATSVLYRHCHLPGLSSGDGLEFIGAFGYYKRSSLEDPSNDFGEVASSVGVLRFDSFPKPLQTVQYGKGSLVGSAGVLDFDATRVWYSLPAFYPNIRAVSIGTAGADIAASPNYRALWWQVDSNGNITRSAVQAADGPTHGTPANEFLVEVDPPPPMGADQIWNLALYRLSATSGLYHLVSSGLPTNLPSGRARRRDSVPDTALDSGPTLYTEGDVLAAYHPPPLLGLVAWDNRLWAISGDDQSQLLHTKLITPSVLPEWHPQLYVTSTHDNANFTGLTVLDDKLIAFKRDSIFVQTAGGPNNNGLGAYASPFKLASDVGCIDRASIVTGSFGVLFQSARGLCLLNRNLQVEYVGRPVETTLAQYPHIYRAVVVPRSSEVRIIVSNTARPEGDVTNTRLLVWNYLYNAWTIHTGPTDASALVDACVWDDAFTVLTRTGFVFKETLARWTDNQYFDHPVPVSFTTPWIKVSGPQGAARVFRALLHGLGRAYTSGGPGEPGGGATTETLRIEAAYDYETTFVESQDYELSTTRFSLEFRPGRQQCNAVRFKIWAPDDSVTQWCHISGLSLEFGVNEGLHPQGNRVS